MSWIFKEFETKATFDTNECHTKWIDSRCWAVTSL